MGVLLGASCLNTAAAAGGGWGAFSGLGLGLGGLPRPRLVGVSAAGWLVTGSALLWPTFPSSSAALNLALLCAPADLRPLRRGYGPGGRAGAFSGSFTALASSPLVAKLFRMESRPLDLGALATGLVVVVVLLFGGTGFTVVLMGSSADERFSRLECCGDEECLEDVEVREEEGRLTGLPGLEAARGCLNTDSSLEEGGLGLGFGIGSSVFTNPFFSTGFLILGGRIFLGTVTVSASWSPSPWDTEGDIGDSGSLKGAHLSWNLE